MTAPTEIESKMAALLGYRPSDEQVKTITMLAEGKSPREVAAALNLRESTYERGSCDLTRLWAAKVCADLGFGDSQRDCDRQGWAAMQAKARAFVELDREGQP